MITRSARALALLLSVAAGACAPTDSEGPNAKRGHIVRAPAAQWRQTVIDADVGTLVGASVQADAGGRLHVAYNPRRDDIRYAVGNASGFAVTAIDSGAGGDAWAPALALGGSRAEGGASVVPASWHEPQSADVVTVFIAWSRRDAGEMRFAAVGGDAVETSVVARTSGSGFSSTAIEVDADGVPHLAWLAGVMDMMYAPRLRHSWRIESGQFIDDEIADAALDEGTALAFDDGGTPHALYFDRALYHASRDGGTWQTEFVGEQGNGLDPALAAAGDGSLHVLCGGSGTHYAHLADGEWTVEQLEEGDEAGLRSSIVVDADERAHGLWLTHGALVYMTRDSAGDFVLEPIDVEVDAGTEPTLAVNVDGTPSVIANVVEGGSTALVLLERER